VNFTIRTLYCLYCPLVRLDHEQGQLRCVVLEREVGPLDQSVSIEAPSDCPTREGVLILFDQVPDPFDRLASLEAKASLLTN